MKFVVYRENNCTKEYFKYVLRLFRQQKTTPWSGFWYLLG